VFDCLLYLPILVHGIGLKDEDMAKAQVRDLCYNCISDHEDTKACSPIDRHLPRMVGRYVSHPCKLQDISFLTSS
jgi:hypothetical protein